MTDHDKLRELAQAARSGPWRHDSQVGMVETVPSGFMSAEDVAYGPSETDLEFIAAANPQAILALLDELRDTKAELLVAWDKGYTDGVGDARAEFFGGYAPNPYRDPS